MRIRLLRDEEELAQQAEIQLLLPDGIYRSRNLNGYAENERQHIVVGAPDQEVPDQEVMVELYTENAIRCGEWTIAVNVWTAMSMISRELEMLVVGEEEMDAAELDDEVVECVKALRNAAPPADEGFRTVTIQPRRIEKRQHAFTDLEKKYRIDY